MIAWLLEDNPADVRAFEVALEESAIPGVKLRKFSRVEDARLALKEESPDVIFVDIVLPGQESGLDFAESYTQSAPILGRKKAAIAIVSGYVDYDYIMRGRAIDAVAHILKPPAPKEIEEVLIKAMVQA